MRKLIPYLIIIALSFLGGAFIANSFYLDEWTGFGRGCYVFITSLLMVGYLGVTENK